MSVLDRVVLSDAAWERMAPLIIGRRSSTAPSSALTSTPLVPERGAEDQALGRSRGGLSTKLHRAVRGLGAPVRLLLTGGQRGDYPQAHALIEGLPADGVMADVVMADAAHDADPLREAIAAKGAVAVIPDNPSRAREYPLDKHLYAQRHLIACCFSRLKQFRRVATRYEKTARNHLAILTLAATTPWLR